MPQRNEMPLKLHISDQPHSDKDRAALVFNGAIVVYRQVDAVHRLVAYLKDRVWRGFAPEDPLTAERTLVGPTYRQTSMRLRKNIAADQETERLFRAVFLEVGCDLDALYWDHLKLRFQPSDSSLHTRYMRDLPAHRDTWGSNILAQINWWAPVWPVSKDCTITMFPDYWENPIENDTAGWSYLEFHRRKEEDPNTSYPMLPTCNTEPAPSQGVPVVVDPGDIIAFSGAHLHASVPNRTGMTRISTETRTVSILDLKAGRQAPNIDGHAEGVRYNWFSQVSSGETLSDSVSSVS